MKMLVGYTGFVGSNLCEQDNFDLLINSRNIELAFGTKPELLIYAGVPSEMFTANSNPHKDKQITDNAFNNIMKINPKRVVLISTVAVYDNTSAVDEDYEINPCLLTPYGRNRYELEQRVSEQFEDSLIVRLPAIYGSNLKKNFIYDCIKYVPALLKEAKYTELSESSGLIRDSYINRGDGFYKCADLDSQTSHILKEEFRKIGFSALNFTDSRSVFQFFNLKYLSKAIESCLSKGIRKINLVPYPVSAAELYKALSGEEFTNECSVKPYNYDVRTKFTESGYIMDKQQEIEEIKAFVENFQK